VEAAVKRILGTGAQMRCQAPLVRHINDDPEVWRTLWKKEVHLGMIPYYMFIARNTGPQAYFEVPLARAHDIFTRAYANVSGLCRTVRGPSMSAAPGKVVVDGIPEIHGEKVFALKFIQARDSSWVNRPFYAKFDETATWLDDLKPAFGRERFFFQDS
jgi:L-lysine 2,3-aminomutase